MNQCSRKLFPKQNGGGCALRKQFAEGCTGNGQCGGGKSRSLSLYELRSLCNARGLSCKKNGVYLTKSELVKRLSSQYGGCGDTPCD